MLVSKSGAKLQKRQITVETSNNIISPVNLMFYNFFEMAGVIFIVFPMFLYTISNQRLRQCRISFSYFLLAMFGGNFMIFTILSVFD